MTEKKRAIFWDLDHTLGHFRSVHYFVKGEDVPEDEPQQVEVRSGLRELLRVLDDQGFLHILTTSATAGYVTNALFYTGLKPFFGKVFTREDGIADQQWKNYVPVAKWMGMTPREVALYSLVIGNQETDKPGDIDDLVFIQQALGYTTDAQVLVPVIHALTGFAGYGDGFKNVLAQKTNTDQWGESHVTLKDGSKLALSYLENNREEPTVPRIILEEPIQIPSSPEIIKLSSYSRS